MGFFIFLIVLIYIWAKLGFPNNITKKGYAEYEDNKKWLGDCIKNFLNKKQ